MSGGSWDYCYFKFEEVASRLKESKNLKRKALGFQIQKIAEALHAIEWVDSGDYAEGDDIKLIEEALKTDARKEAIKDYLKETEANLIEVKRLLEELC